MRHFCDINKSESVFFTLVTEGGLSGVEDGYRQSISSGISVFEAVVACLEVSIKDALEYVRYGESMALSPNECRVLDDYITFNALVELALIEPEKTDLSLSLSSDGVYSRRAAFHYANLNEGKSVVWFLFLE